MRQIALKLEGFAWVCVEKSCFYAQKRQKSQDKRGREAKKKVAMASESSYTSYHKWKV